MCSMPRKKYQCLALHFKLFSTIIICFIAHCPFSIPMQRVWSTYLNSSGHRQERSSDPNLVRANTHHDNFLFTHCPPLHSFLPDGERFSVCLFCSSSQLLLTPLAVVPRSVCLLPRQHTPQLAPPVIYSVAITMPALATTILPVV
jgi:hypothetical protein